MKRQGIKNLILICVFPVWIRHFRIESRLNCQNFRMPNLIKKQRLLQGEAFDMMRLLRLMSKYDFLIETSF